MHWPITVASFRTWRGSQDYIARDPASDTIDINIRFRSPLKRSGSGNRRPTPQIRIQC